MSYFKDICKTLVSEEAIQKKVAELGKQITQDYQGKELIVACVLKGSFIFTADLVRQINLPLTIDFISASSYGRSATSSGNVQIYKDLEIDLTEKHLLLVEDIVDTGLTIQMLKEMYEKRNLSSVKIASLLDKPSRRRTEVEIDYCGFTVPDEFVVGYGLDYADKYRNIPYVTALDSKIYE